MNCGKAPFVLRRQYTTNRAKTEAGRTFPKYKMYLGVGFPGLKAMNGMKRVSMVAATPAATMTICCKLLIASLLSLLCSISFLSFLVNREK